jgi:transcriptional regulator
MLKAIVGLEIKIERIEGKAKLSQNRDDRDRLGAADALKALGRDTLSVAMRAANPTSR